MSDRLDELFQGLPLQLDVHAVAEVLGTSTKGVYKWLQTGVIPAYKVGSTWIVLRDELKDTLAMSRNLAGRLPPSAEDDEPPSQPLS